MNPNDAYEWLRKHSTETSYLSSLGELTAWDQRTYLPNKGHRLRSEQLALLARMLHERATDPYVGECLGKVEGTDVVADPTSPAAVNVREWQRAFERLTRIPKSLAESLARATSEGETAWERAREDNDWQSFKPYLETIVSLLSGPGQVGKNTLSKMLFQRLEYLSYDFAEHRLAVRERSWDRQVDLLVLDELHKMKNWKSWLEKMALMDAVSLSSRSKT